MEHKDIDNIFDFYKKNNNNIILTKIIEYEEKTDYYLNTDYLYYLSLKTIVFQFQLEQFEFYNDNHILDVKLSASEKEFYFSDILTKFENKTLLINNTILFINLYTDEFKLGDLILYEFKGNKSTFNSTNIYIQSSLDSQTEIYNKLKNCSELYIKDEIIISCNFTKNSENYIILMLLLNEGNTIFIRNINPEEKKTPDNKENNENKTLKYVLFIGIPIIVIIFIIIFIVIAILIKRKCRKNKVDAFILYISLFCFFIKS